MAEVLVIIALVSACFCLFYTALRFTIFKNLKRSNNNLKHWLLLPIYLFIIFVVSFYREPLIEFLGQDLLFPIFSLLAIILLSVSDYLANGLKSSLLILLSGITTIIFLTVLFMNNALSYFI
ncbi:hypothetical protein [Alkalibacillus haloalkaliphilus]|uniref:hypothetical protein n=1 Tax=Alkalibacillus haloalkaliphilus TaxID=94136 RepID=UPI00037DB741|nr:hypothetical protein [Alkalibacillus haloalkaliphilus]